MKKKKKKRTGKRQIDSHNLVIEIDKDIQKDTQKNIASETEIKKCADRHHIYYELFQDETLKFLIGIKNELFLSMKEFGLSIYRNALERFFAVNQEKIIYYQTKNGQNKVANYFKDFYVLEEIKKALLDAAHKQLNYADAPNIGSMMTYYLKYASRNHLVLFDHDLHLSKINWTSLTSFDDMTDIWSTSDQPTNAWQALYHDVKVAYDEAMPKLLRNKLGHVEAVDKVRDWAKKGYLTQKQELIRAYDELRHELFIFPAKQVKRTKPEALDFLPSLSWLENQ